MKPLTIILLAGLVSTGSGGCQGFPVPETRIGINMPAPGTERVFRWERVPGASAYQVVVTTDRAGTQPAGVTGFTSDTQTSMKTVAWRDGHPLVGRPYFWTVRAYDRPDPQGVLLTVRGPMEVQFEGSDVPQVMPEVSPSPSASPSGPPVFAAPSAAPSTAP